MYHGTVTAGVAQYHDCVSCACAPNPATQAMARRAALADSASEMQEARMASITEQREDAVRAAHDLQLQLNKVGTRHAHSS